MIVAPAALVRFLVASRQNLLIAGSAAVAVSVLTITPIDHDLAGPLSMTVRRARGPAVWQDTTYPRVEADIVASVSARDAPCPSRTPCRDGAGASDATVVCCAK